MRIILWIVGAVLWGVVVFLAALHVHFPSETLLDRAKYEVERGSDGGWAIDAAGLDLWRVTGVSADELVLYSVESAKRRRRRVRRRASGSDDVDNAEEEEPEALRAKPFLRVDQLRGRLAVLPLLFGDRQVNFDAELLSGDLDGSFSESGTRRRVAFDARELDLSTLPIGGKTWSVDAGGALQLTADLDLDSENPRESTGEIHLQVDQFAIRSAKAMGIELTPVVFSEAVLDVNVANGKAEIVKGVLDGDILDATFSGNIAMSKREWSKWRMRVEVKLELDDTLDQFAKFSPDLKDARDDEGVYHLTCMGLLTRPSCTADRVASGKAKGGGVRAAAQERRKAIEAGTFEAPDRAERDEDRDQRRQARLDRIQQRRDRLRQERKAEEEGEDLEDVIDPPLPEFVGQDGPRPMRMRPEFDPEPLDPDAEFDGPDDDQFLPDDMPLEPPLPPFEEDDMAEPY